MRQVAKTGPVPEDIAPSPADPLAVVRDLLYGWAALAAAGDARCRLAGAGAGEMDPPAPQAARCPPWPALERELVGCLERASALGESRDAAVLARYLLAAMQGIAVVGRIHPDPAHLRVLAERALAALD